MVTIQVGDLFESEAQTLVNTVNTVGVMGKGIALEFKRRFPEMYEDYVRRCTRDEVRLGEPYLFRRLVPPWIINFPTKGHWRAISRLSDIVAGLKHLERHYRRWGITSLAVPPLGCGQGQLEWRVVGPTLYRHLGCLDIRVELYAPHGTPRHELDEQFLSRGGTGEPDARAVSRIDPAWVALVEIVARVEREPYHWPVGRVTFQKIAFFATEVGIPTGLRYVRGSYGPYAAELKPLTTRLVNNGLLREQQLGRMFAVKVGPTYPDARKVFEEQLQQWEEWIERVSDLFLRLNTSQAEVAATVYFAAQELNAALGHTPSERDVVDEVSRWKLKRRPPLEPGAVATAVRTLHLLGWLRLKASRDLPIEDDPLLGFEEAAEV
jgi:O-acetyl-ADP-ribose deacetylase (regulator of RNase III)/uncharacterized protein YwgA